MNSVPARFASAWIYGALTRDWYQFKQSHPSHFVQACDLAAFLLLQHLAPNSYMRKKSGQNYFLRLAPVLYTVASSTDTHGIVRL